MAGHPAGRASRRESTALPPQDPLAAPRQNGGGGPSLSRAPSLLRPLRGPLARCFQQKVLPAHLGSTGDSSPVTPQLPPSPSAGPLAWHPGRLVSAAAAGRGPRAAAGQMAAWPAAPGRHCPHRCDASCHPSAETLLGRQDTKGWGQAGGRGPSGGCLGQRLLETRGLSSDLVTAGPQAPLRSIPPLAQSAPHTLASSPPPSQPGSFGQCPDLDGCSMPRGLCQVPQEHSVPPARQGTLPALVLIPPSAPRGWPPLPASQGSGPSQGRRRWAAQRR